MKNNIWPTATREDLKNQPTGKYKVPVGYSLLSEVYDFFGKYCENCFVHKHKEDDSFIVCLDQTFILPPPNTIYLDERLLKDYHISTPQYWDLLEKCDKTFEKLCKPTKGEISFSPRPVLTGRIVGLPTYSYREAYYRKLTTSEKTKFSILVEEENYSNFMKFMATRSYVFPLIESCVLEDSKITIKVIVKKPTDIFTFLSTENRYVNQVTAQ
jgi:hypothetical protein